MMNDYELVIRNARIVDGSASPWYRGDVGINGGIIEFVGGLPEEVEAKTEIDAGDMILAPGFVDIHTHNDFALLRDSHLLTKLKQGVTTQMIGQCGISPAPIKKETVELIDAYTGFVKAGAEPSWEWRRFSEYLDVLDSLELGLNVGAFVGHGTIRLNVLGFDSRDPDEEELGEMRQLAYQAMEDGAFGMTSGLIYPPGVYSKPKEITEIARGLVDRQGIYLSHMRNESNTVVEAVQETIAVAEDAGIPGQVVHHKACGQKNFGLVKKTLKLLEEARERGVDMTVDQYPYAASSTTLRSILPPWVHEGGVEKVLGVLKDPEKRKRIRKEIETTENWENMLMHSGGFDGVMVVYTPKTPQYEGKTLTEIGEILGNDPLEAAFDIIVENRGSDNACYFMLDENDVKYVMKHPLVMIGSDSIPAAPGAKCHPRTNGTFPRVLGKYVRQEKTLRLEEAVWKMTGFPATRLNLQKKGFIKRGMDADLVLFDPETVIDGATFEEPFNEPVGILKVIIDGKVVMEDNEFTGIAAGKVLRKN